ncbi:MAG: hypothetical protein GXP29_12990 [Planctomycetes bacterium]|nr:hypothetical protein [Planctomycetota bacterium]
MDQSEHQIAEANAQTTDEPQREPRIDWDNPDTLAGDAPPMSRVPLILSIVVYAGWLVFLVSMAYMRIRTTSQ